MILAPPWALAAEAVDGAGDTHLVKGIHLRCVPAPAAGLPATPLLVYRTVLNPDQAASLAHRTAVTWIDSHGQVLTAPFDVQPGNPVTGHLGGGHAIWARLTARPATPPDGLTFAALVNSPAGLAELVRRDRDPYLVAAQRIDAVRVSGQGRVSALSWADQDEALKGTKQDLIMVWSLPVDRRPRYRPTPDARSEAKDRVDRGAPTRLPQYAVMGQSDPASSPPAGSSFSLGRLSRMEPELGRWLDRVLGDTLQPTFDLRDQFPIDGADGQVALPIEPHLLASSLDPDAGHWLGLGDVDQKLDVPAGSLALYLIRGLWRDAPQQWHPFQRAALASRSVATADKAGEEFPDLGTHDLLPDQPGPFLDLAALAAAPVGLPPLRPPVPALVSFEDRGWLAEPPPPEVRRHLRLRLDGVGPRSLLAAVADDGLRRTLNPVLGEGRPQPGQVPAPETMLGITVTRPPDATGPGQTRLDDRAGNESGATYLVAQGDWFGRWGEWANLAGPPKARTPPQAPALELAYQPPALVPGGVVPDGALAGIVTVRVAITRQADLPPGGHLLDRLELTRIDGGSPPAVITVVLGAAGTMIETHPAPAHDVLVLTAPGPALERAASTTVEITGRWIDAAGLVSPPGPPAHRDAVDPRPPALPVVPTELQFSARPDATGFARVELTWPSVPGTRYRVFATTETTLLGALRNNGQGAVADAIAATPAGAARALAIRAQRSRFSWDAFECVTANPIVAAGPTTTFVHRLSGSLEVLAGYRVLSEGPSGVLAEMTEAEIVPVAVPNLGPPPPPSASLAPIPFDHDVTTDGITLEVLVLPGRAVPVSWRVRRASVAVADGLRMDVVAAGDVPAGSAGPSGTRFEIPLAQRLQPWRQYRFAVEVQAGPPPGAPTSGPVPAGEWSPPSAPVPVATIPPAGPEPPSALEATAESGGVRLRVTHPRASSLIGTPFGAHRFEVYRLSPGARPTRLDLHLDLAQAVGDTFEAVDPAPPDGSAWSVRVVDPVGRVSTPVTAKLAGP